jgi:aspartate/tyrosine/aromatic aminotransferase
MTTPLAIYDSIDKEPPDAVFGIQDLFNKALAQWKSLPAGSPEGGHSHKPISLTLGAYRDEQGKPWVLPTVRTVSSPCSHLISIPFLNLSD